MYGIRQTTIGSIPATGEHVNHNVIQRTLDSKDRITCAGSEELKPVTSTTCVLHQATDLNWIVPES